MTTGYLIAAVYIRILGDIPHKVQEKLTNCNGVISFQNFNRGFGMEKSMHRIVRLDFSEVKF